MALVSLLSQSPETKLDALTPWSSVRGPSTGSNDPARKPAGNAKSLAPPHPGCIRVHILTRPPVGPSTS